MPSKYTKEVLEPLAKTSTSVRAIVIALGLKYSGGTHSLIKKRLRETGVSTLHFLGQASNRGKHVGGMVELLPDQVLVLDRLGGHRENIRRLRKAMLRSGFEERCSECLIPPTWNGKPLRIQVDHRNGNPIDNRRENVRFICPNCHSQTDTFGNKNIHRSVA